MLLLCLSLAVVVGCSKPAPAPSSSPSGDPAKEAIRQEMIAVYKLQDDVSNRDDVEGMLALNADSIIVDGKTYNREQQKAYFEEARKADADAAKDIGDGPLITEQHQEVHDVVLLGPDRVLAKTSNRGSSQSKGGRWRMEWNDDQTEIWERQDGKWKCVETTSKETDTKEYFDGKLLPKE